MKYIKSTIGKIALGLLILSAIFLVMEKFPRTSTPPPAEIKPGQNPYFVRSIPDVKRNQKRPLDAKDRYYEKSLHEGSALIVGPYRMELAVEETKQATIWAIFLDNYLAQPVLPNHTDIVLEVNKQKVKLMAVKNGLMAAPGPKPTFPLTVSVSGKINNNPFSTVITVNNWRKKSVLSNE